MMVDATKFQPPGPWLQNLNALLHKEPYASLAHGFYWILFLVFVPPVASIWILVCTVYKILSWSLGWMGDNKYKPSKHDDTELGVVITGCDSGFGKELALLADSAGFHVFAGCLSKDSFDHFRGTSIAPILMDVTKDEQVNAAVEAVQKWIAEAPEKKKRVLHALCNNAGIIRPVWVDWMDMKDIEMMMDGMLL